MGPIKECRLGYEDLIDKERLRDSTQFIFGALPKPLYKAINEEGKTLLDRMSKDKHSFSLYGLLCLAANKWGLCELTFREIKEVLGIGNDAIIRARDSLEELSLILWEATGEKNDKKPGRPTMKWQITSLPIWVIQQMGIRKRTQNKDELTKALEPYGLTKGYGDFPSEPEQDQLIVKIMRDLNLQPEVQESIKTGLRRGKIRVKRQKRATQK